MVFKSKLLFSSKKSGSSSPNNANSPRSVGSNSPVGSDKKKPKSNSKEEIWSSYPKKDGSSKGKEAWFEVHSSSPGKSKLSSSGSEAAKKKPLAETPIMASSLGLNRIKTRSGPLPQENFFRFGNDDELPVLPCYKLSKFDTSSGRGKKEAGSSKADHKSLDIGTLRSSSSSPASGNGQLKVLPSISSPEGSSGVCTPEEILNLIRTKFDKAKEEVNSDLFAFGGDLLDIYDKNKESHPELLVPIENLLVLAKICAKTTSGDFWLQCEGIVQDLDDKRQELPPGVLKQLHTRMLFILTRCTRLFQFHKESWGQEEDAEQLCQSRVLHLVDKRVPTGEVRDGMCSSTANNLKVPSTQKAYSQKQRDLNWNEGSVVSPAPLSSPYNEMSKDSESPANIDKMSSWKRLPSPASKGVKEASVSKEQNDSKSEPPQVVKNRVAMSDDMAVSNSPDILQEHMSKHPHNISWGYWGDQSCISEENSIICRICEEEVPSTHVEDHSRICALADVSDQKGASVDERLAAVAVTLEKITENLTQKDSLAVVESPDGMKISNASFSEEFDVLSPKLSDWSRRGSEEMLDCLPDANNLVSMDDMRFLPSMSCRTRFGQGMTTSSAGSMTPKSPIPTPRRDPIELILVGKGILHDQDDISQMSELADIARCASKNIPVDDQSIQLLLSCLEDLRVVIDNRKFDALIIETFGTRIEKLIREKYLQLCELLGDENFDLSSTIIDEDAPLEDDVVRSLRTSPVHPRDRISVDDFDFVKEISRGAFGHVILARKKTTGDLFAIKVLRKADMIRKNAVESIHAERDILINARNPFVVRFFYSFTCSENLYLVMEYLNGGDFYSMLRKFGCLDETNARVYIAEVVLALEYLHSEGVVHRDLKPDNLLIAHDGHVKLTDFGLSKVGLINSTDDLSRPVSSATSLLVEQKPKWPTLEHKRSAVGTPDYLAPEILLGTGHGATADWWSVGIILYEFIVGIPPFNADHPQQIFDNILNRNIQWPPIPEDMSHEARDLIDRLLREDPHQRLGARGAAEVKQHIFFKDINWHTLAQQKAAFVPDSENAFDTSYFHSRYSEKYPDEECLSTNENEDSSDGDSLSGSSGRLNNHHDEGVDIPRGPAESETGVSENYPFNNFSFKVLSHD
ncbi:PREDICTED: probable serine/threonine protein kinase IRE3, partial [Camelina sativa]|uniref:non-specific serine/threonine protein kinase n=1 Tax=Camelina sativa TaxID=90675 RepID=A0ABM0VYW6_CAMSA